LESANFRVCGIASPEQIKALLDTCEATRSRLSAQWLGSHKDGDDDKRGVWEPKCYIVLHPTAQSYLREVGEGQMTAGSSLIEFAGNRLVTRRVDLRADHPEGYFGALAHELTHVVVADHFVERQIPRWADEGMAVLADTQGKQSLHHADLGVARANRTTFRLIELMQLENYPEASRQGAFYGQSASLVRFLVARAGERAFVGFLTKSNEIGYDAALRDVYQFSGVAELERHWSRHLEAAAAPPRVRATPAVVSQASIPAAQPVSYTPSR
jgi:peptidase MA superfamily protein